MKQQLVKFKNVAFLVAAGVLLLGLLAGLNLRADHRVQAAPGEGVDYFLKIDGITGESTDEKHKGEIDLSSFAWSKDNPGLQQTGSSAGGGGGAGKVQMHDLFLTHKVDKASPRLMLATANGKHLKEAVLTVRKAGKGQQEFMTVKMSDILVTSYRTTGHDMEAPTDEFSLNFAKIEFSVSPQKADGTLDIPAIGTWDFEQNKAE